MTTISKKTILDSELTREIIAIRTNTLWKMLLMKNSGELPDIYEEGATGKYDNKGAIFIPGGLVHQDVDEQPIHYSAQRDINSTLFREKIRRAMRYDNATLLYSDGIAFGVNLDTGFFSRAARRINVYKKAAFRRKRKIGTGCLFQVSSDDIIRSHCPGSFIQPYGARTRISSCAAIGLIEPAMFLAFCQAEFNFSKEQTSLFQEQLDQALEPAIGSDGQVLYQPHIIVCHDTRYSRAAYTGFTRFLGLGRFGEFASFSLEEADSRLLRELKRRQLDFDEDDVFAEFGGRKILGLLRCYRATNPGKRSAKHQLHVLSPFKDLRLDRKEIEEQARQQYSYRSGDS